MEQHYRSAAKALLEGRVVPLLGAGVNLCGRPADARWGAGSPYLPSGIELAEYLAIEFGYPVDDLVRVAETVAVMEGTARLYEKLRLIFDADYGPTSLHRFLARLPATLRDHGQGSPYLLVVTTNYDDTVERAFREAGEPFDLVWYQAEGEDYRGKFWHLTHPQESSVPRVIDRPNEYTEISLDERSVILKVHGAVDRVNADGDSYVITEDHYIDYLTRTDIASLVPIELVAKLKRSHFLFLGYALRDWNVRVILHRIWEEQPFDFRSWAIQRNTHAVDELLWHKRNVSLFDVDLDEYVTELGRRIQVPL
ncbi:MAG TPA: SIR2 family protein [Gaiellaceae bacterium]